MAVSEIKRIETLIRSILNFAKPAKPQFSRVNINEVLEQSLTFSLQSVSFKQDSSAPVRIMKDFDHGLPEITADPMQLHQVFINLFINAGIGHDGRWHYL